ncbi:helix-turn-helix transcriptional regulator [Mucilaginibacter robiniae]|uniref:Helix-turn-helix transcriptional regulator n=1 Tax=Mucilaginibacter robiniae TaxID=2728022 RepID=A0A7L5E4F7_9SPHI|nr:helix-turn-helix transcriptional regulator [Mucilaginibacter robiniae]QJD97179.1 helix-turn-helix transcriptional regulator [Mucilaginibacter robiniae]
MAETLHIGRKIARIRELKGIKQEALAIDLNISQQTVSNFEKSEKIEDEVLNKIAKALGVAPEAIKNFNEEAVINYFNTFNDNSFTNGAYNAFSCNFNPIDKWLEVIEENKRLYNEKVELLERLLASEREKNELLRNK